MAAPDDDKEEEEEEDDDEAPAPAATSVGLWSAIALGVLSREREEEWNTSSGSLLPPAVSTVRKHSESPQDATRLPGPDIAGVDSGAAQSITSLNVSGAVITELPLVALGPVPSSFDPPPPPPLALPA